MSLTDFYHTLSLPDIAWVVFIIVCTDKIGSLLSLLLNIPNYVRPMIWVVGLAAVSQLWHLIINSVGFHKPLLVTALISLTLVSGLIASRKHSHLPPLNKSDVIILLVTLLPIIAPLMVKLSLPPYHPDEIGYHYFSPSQILYFKEHKARNDFYGFLPQGMDTVYRVTFALTNSYSGSRLINLSIALSGILSVASWVQKRWGNSSHLFWLLLSPYLVANFISSATLGAVDIAVAFVILVALIVASESLHTQLHTVFALFGVAVGMKYSSLVPIVASSWSFVIIRWDEFIHVCRKPKHLSVYMIIFILLGGSIFIRNISRHRMLTYPVGSTQTFFSGWTIPLTLQNFPKITYEVFSGNNYLFIISGISLVLLIIAKSTGYKQLIFLANSIFLEILIVKYLGGFYPRYYLHWPYIFGIFLSSSIVIDNLVGNKLYRLFLLIIYIVVLVHASHVIQFVNSEEFTPSREKQYASKKINIENWLEDTMSKSIDIIKHCGDKQKPQRIYIFDPEIMWFSFYGQPVEFMVNCIPYKYQIGKDNKNDIIEKLSNSSSVYIASVSKCLKAEDVNTALRDSAESGNEVASYPHALQQRALNNQIVCQSRNITENIYEINSSILISSVSKHSTQ